MESLITILHRLWSILVTFIRGSNASSPSSLLPLSMKVCKKIKSAGWRWKSTEDSIVWEAQKEEFLRHPSLRLKQDRHQNKPKTKASKSHKRHKSGRFAQVTVNLHDWSAPPPTQPPLRPPRPPSSSVPSVIITPCTPTGDGLLSAIQECIYTTTHNSPLELTLAALLLTESSPPDAQGERDVACSTRDDKPGSDPPINEGDITDAGVLDAGHNQPAFLPVVTSPPTPVVLPNPRESVDSDLQWRDFKVLGSFDSPWASSGSTNSLEANASYFTSTPTKKPLAENRRLARYRVELDTPTPCGVGTPHMLRLPDEQLDLLPYPDVFDFDIYYGDKRFSSPTTDSPASSSNTRFSVDYEKNPFAPQESSPYLGTSPDAAYYSSPSISSSTPGTSQQKPPRSFGFIPDNADVNLDHEVKRYRDHYRHPAYTVSPQASSENTSGDSLPYSTPTPNPRGASVIHLAPSGTLTARARSRATVHLPLRDVTNRKWDENPPRTPRSVAGKVLPVPQPQSQSNSETMEWSAEKPEGNPPPPIVVISHHRFGSSSPDSLAGADASSDALKASLQDMCNLFSRSVSRDSM